MNDKETEKKERNRASDGNSEIEIDREQRKTEINRGRKEIDREKKRKTERER